MYIPDLFVDLYYIFSKQKNYELDIVYKFL